MDEYTYYITVSHTIRMNESMYVANVFNGIFSGQKPIFVITKIIPLIILIESQVIPGSYTS